ncbi:MAG: hypothetical protein ACYC43_01510 [Burkholderiales bacterium]
MQALTNQNNAPFPAITLKELTEILIKEKKLHSGLFDLTFEFQIAVGGVGPSNDLIMPGIMLGVSKVGLIGTQNLGPHTVDAALVNPLKALARKSKKNSNKNI